MEMSSGRTTAEPRATTARSAKADGTADTLDLVIGDPDASLAEWLESQGRNASMEISVPDAALRLVQASGRLLRTESDTGRVTLLDRRLLTRRYGRAILDSLPPFTRQFE